MRDKIIDKITDYFDDGNNKEVERLTDDLLSLFSVMKSYDFNSFLIGFFSGAIGLMICIWYVCNFS